MPTLEWIGKKKVVTHHTEVPYRVLKRIYSFDKKGQHKKDNGSKNMIIHGDNLDALKALLPIYEGKVQCVYIDPPYNTGEEGWKYNDNSNDPKISKWINQTVGKEGEDFSRHDKWLCMMYPRLVLLRKLLKETGVIFISIDDTELAYLKIVCDEIFGRNCFVCNFIWEKRKNRENRKVISIKHDYILCYCKNREYHDTCLHPLSMTQEALNRYSNPDNDPRGPWQSTTATAQAGHATPSQFYNLVAPNGKIHHLPSGRCWVHTKEAMQQQIQDGRIWFGADGNNVPRKKTFLYEKERGLTPETILFSEDVETNEVAKKQIKMLFPKETIPFDTPKPIALMEFLLKLVTDKNSLVIDSFAGSGTTFHAVLNLNVKDGGNRHFIGVELCDYANDITAKRVKQAICGYGKGKDFVRGTGGDFSFFELGEKVISDDGLFNETLSRRDLEAYVWTTETRSQYNPTEGCEFGFLGIHNDTAYYFFYDKVDTYTLNRKLLREIKHEARHYVVFADSTTFSESELAKYSITFKKLTRDIIKN